MKFLVESFLTDCQRDDNDDNNSRHGTIIIVIMMLLTSCRSGPVLSLPTISFELHVKTAEEIDLEKCNFRNFGTSVTLTLTLDRVEVTLVRVCLLYTSDAADE